MYTGFFHRILCDGKVDDGACGDGFGEEDGGEFNLVVVLRQEDGHARVELANGKLHLGRGLRHFVSKRTWQKRLSWQ